MNGYQGGTIIVISDQIVGSIDKDSIKIDKLGKWSTFTMSNNNKKVLFITIYRISQSSDQGVYKSLSQYNNINGKIITATKYRKEVFTEIVHYTQSLEGINNIILGRDINQNIESIEVKTFYM